jgi:hypothetical protein
VTRAMDPAPAFVRRGACEGLVRARAAPGLGPGAPWRSPRCAVWSGGQALSWEPRGRGAEIQRPMVYMNGRCAHVLCLAVGLASRKRLFDRKPYARRVALGS